MSVPIISLSKSRTRPSIYAAHQRPKRVNVSTNEGLYVKWKSRKTEWQLRIAGKQTIRILHELVTYPRPITSYLTIQIRRLITLTVRSYSNARAFNRHKEKIHMSWWIYRRSTPALSSKRWDSSLEDCEVCGSATLEAAKQLFRKLVQDPKPGRRSWCSHTR
jgi:hypothetical protein